ncbi:MAG: hypothetical protein J6M05_04380 [Cardiobacteriaceae bacterium]|nr:hypothetical protein [Cardiobacteriaceae bacterium]
MKKSCLSLAVCAMFTTAAISPMIASADNNTRLANAVIAGAIVYFSQNDGYYYDENYNRLPHGYKPPKHYKVNRVQDMRIHRRNHPLPPPAHNGKHNPPPPPARQGANPPPPAQRGANPPPPPKQGINPPPKGVNPPPTQFKGNGNPPPPANGNPPPPPRH